jgi:hypothetical protein
MTIGRRPFLPLLVYHSDGVDHGQQRGQIGVTAHHQLIIRVP